jgi:hypothetical protein
VREGEASLASHRLEVEEMEEVTRSRDLGRHLVVGLILTGLNHPRHHPFFQKHEIFKLIQLYFNINIFDDSELGRGNMLSFQSLLSRKITN